MKSGKEPDWTDYLGDENKNTEEPLPTREKPPAQAQGAPKIIGGFGNPDRNIRRGGGGWG